MPRPGNAGVVQPRVLHTPLSCVQHLCLLCASAVEVRSWEHRALPYSHAVPLLHRVVGGHVVHARRRQCWQD